MNAKEWRKEESLTDVKWMQNLLNNGGSEFSQSIGYLSSLTRQSFHTTFTLEWPGIRINQKVDTCGQISPGGRLFGGDQPVEIDSIVDAATQTPFTESRERREQEECHDEDEESCRCDDHNGHKQRQANDRTQVEGPVGHSPDAGPRFRHQRLVVFQTLQIWDQILDFRVVFLHRWQVVAALIERNGLTFPVITDITSIASVEYEMNLAGGNEKRISKQV